MKLIDLTLHFLNDAEFNKAFIVDFEQSMLGAKYNIPLKDKRCALMDIRDELSVIVHNLVEDHTQCHDFTEWLTAYIVPEIVTDEKFNLTLSTININVSGNFEEDMKARIASIIFQEFQLKTIYHIQSCQNCHKIYIPKRLDPKAKYCGEDCKHEHWMKENPDKKVEYKKKRANR